MRIYCKVDRVNGTKQCADCGEVKPLSSYHIRKTGSVYAYCNPCNTRRAVEWSANNRERKSAGAKARHARKPKEWKRNKHYRDRYGISYDDVRSLLEKQNFRCEICGTEISEMTVCVDHCHERGKVRGALCNLCNISLAPIERKGFLEAALAYLERHRSGS